MVRLCAIVYQHKRSRLSVFLPGAFGGAFRLRVILSSRKKGNAVECIRFRAASDSVERHLTG